MEVKYVSMLLSCQYLLMNFVTSTLSSVLLSMGYGLWVMGYGLWVMGYGWKMGICLFLLASICLTANGGASMHHTVDQKNAITCYFLVEIIR